MLIPLRTILNGTQKEQKYLKVNYTKIDHKSSLYLRFIAFSLSLSLPRIIYSLNLHDKQVRIVLVA